MKTTILLMTALCCNVSCSSPPPKQIDIVSIRTTAYTHNESDHLKYGRKTATGKTLKRGIIATDWSIFPVGTILSICGHEYVVEDYGSALVKSESIKIPTVDIYTISKSEMNKWGVKFFNDVKIVEMGSYHESLNILKDRLKHDHCKTMFDRIQAKL